MQASGRELVWVLRTAIVVCGVLATVIAVTADSIYGLFVLCSDLMYVVLFPQLTLILWFHRSNAYGCLAGYFLSFLLRILAGEPLLGLPCVLRFPLYDPLQGGQLFPFRTFVMLCNVLTTMAVSVLSQVAFSQGWLPARFDVLGCLRLRTIAVRDKKSQAEGEPMTGKAAGAVTSWDQVRWTGAKEKGEEDSRVGDRVFLARPENDDAM